MTSPFTYLPYNMTSVSVCMCVCVLVPEKSKRERCTLRAFLMYTVYKTMFELAVTAMARSCHVVKYKTSLKGRGTFCRPKNTISTDLH